MTTNEGSNAYRRGVAHARDFIAAHLEGSRSHGDSCGCPACHVTRSPAMRRILEEASSASRQELLDEMRGWRVTDHSLNCFCDLCETARHTLRNILDNHVVGIVAFLQAVPDQADAHVNARTLESAGEPAATSDLPGKGAGRPAERRRQERPRPLRTGRGATARYSRPGPPAA